MRFPSIMLCLAWALLFVSPLGARPQCNDEPNYCPRQLVYNGAAVDITWDAYGVPQVSSATDEGAFFGWGYAMAVDRFFQMEVNRRAIRGRLAELIGNDFLPLAKDAGLWQVLMLLG